jgi:hypothetical protein
MAIIGMQRCYQSSSTGQARERTKQDGLATRQPCGVHAVNRIAYHHTLLIVAVEAAIILCEALLCR